MLFRAFPESRVETLSEILGNVCGLYEIVIVL